MWEIPSNVVERVSFRLQPRRPGEPDHQTPPLAVAKREAARLLGVCERTVENYVALKAIRSVRGKRVLIPMRSLHEVATKGNLVSESLEVMHRRSRVPY
jgi:hypothetical protein